MKIADAFLGFFIVLGALGIVIASTVYFSWAYSLVLLKGYNWFLISATGIPLQQIQIAAAVAMISSVISSVRSIIKPEDTRSTGERVGDFIGLLCGPWGLLLFLWILTLL